MASHAVNKLNFSREMMKDIFREHDLDGDRTLSISEVNKAFKSLGHLCPMNKAHYGMAYADEDGDGCITEDELDNLIDYAEKFMYKKY